MKILQLGKFYPIRGGVEKVMWDLTRGLARRSAAGEAGVSCDMLCAMLPGDGIDEADRPLLASPEGEWPRVLQFGPDSRCVCVKALTKKAATMISPAMVRWLRRHAAEYDLIHVHHPDPMAALALRLSGYKGRVFVHWHSDIVKQKGLLKLYLPLQTWLLRRAERIVGTTPVYARESPYLTDYQHKVCYIPIGVEDNIRLVSEGTSERSDGGSLRGTPLNGNCAEGTSVQLFALGRLVEYKGFEYLVEGARGLPENYCVEIGGEGPLREELQRRIDATGVRVKLLGRISDAQVRRKMNECAVFVLPSVMKTEAFGIVQVEAMSCGKPVVATTIPGSGTSWVNEDGVSGFNVPPRDSKALAEAILKLTADPQTLQEFGARARKRYETLFTIDAMVDKYLEMI